MIEWAAIAGVRQSLATHPTNEVDAGPRDHGTSGVFVGAGPAGTSPTGGNEDGDVGDADAGAHQTSTCVLS